MNFRGAQSFVERSPVRMCPCGKKPDASYGDRGTAKLRTGLCADCWSAVRVEQPALFQRWLGAVALDTQKIIRGELRLFAQERNGKHSTKEDANSANERELKPEIAAPMNAKPIRENSRNSCL